MLFDAVAILASSEGAALLAQDATARDFVSDAFVHCKFIGYSAEVQPLFEKSGLVDELDEGCVLLAKSADAKTFVEALNRLRFWPRELRVDPDAKA